MKATDIIYYTIHFSQLRSIIQWKVWHTPPHERDPAKEPESVKRCFELLDLTSRSFAAVIKELHPELLMPVVVFYLVLRGLDTIEDDMTLSLGTKEPMLRDFYNKISQDGWNFDGSGPNEKDRELLVEFRYVVTEFNKIKPAYQKIIKDIAKQMGNGMADYCKNAEHNANGVDTIADYDLYCHYVAGLVGNGLTRLFVESELANPALLERPQLQDSMGLFLQKTNIIRDVKEDWDDKRRFWPKEIWSKHVTNFEDLFKPENETIALQCSSEMVLNALNHINDCMFYLAGLREQSVFNFAAIPQAMAIATLEVVFRNPDVFKKNVKITKGEACKAMLASTQDLKTLYGVFREYGRKIHKKNNPRDPSFMKISVACGKIEQFIEGIFPTQNIEAVTAAVAAGEPVPEPTEKTPAQIKAEKEAKEDTFYMLVAVFGVIIGMSMFMFFVAWCFGARFDLAFKEIAAGRLWSPGNPEDVAAAKAKHGEL